MLAQIEINDTTIRAFPICQVDTKLLPGTPCTFELAYGQLQAELSEYHKMEYRFNSGFYEALIIVALVAGLLIGRFSTR